MLAYVPQDANVLSKGSPFMGEEVEGTTKTILGRYYKNNFGKGLYKQASEGTTKNRYMHKKTPKRTFFC